MYDFRQVTAFDHDARIWYNSDSCVKEVSDRPTTNTDNNWKEVDTRGAILADPVTNQRKRIQANGQFETKNETNKEDHSRRG